MSTYPVRIFAVLLLVIAASCAREQSPPAASAELLAGIPAFPGSRPVSSSAGADAVQSGYLAAQRPDSVASWYRAWLVKDGWEISGDVRGGDGSITLHAEKGTRPLWLILQPLADHLGTRYSVIGAEADSSNARSPRS
jgi:hypothetical protein